MTYTSPTKKARIVLLRSEGVSEKEVAERYTVDRSTVNRIFKRNKESKNFYHTKEKSGRPRKFTTHDVRIATRMLASTKAHDVADLQRQHFPNLHPDTIRKRLTKCGLKAYVLVLNLSCPMHTRNNGWDGHRHMHIGPLRTGNWLYLAMSLNLIYLGLMVVAGVGGSLGRNLMKDM